MYGRTKGRTKPRSEKELHPHCPFYSYRKNPFVYSIVGFIKVIFSTNNKPFFSLVKNPKKPRDFGRGITAIHKHYTVEQWKNWAEGASGQESP